MELLQIQDIVFINRKTIDKHGGKFVPPNNLHRNGALEYLVEAVDGELFGEPMYPEFTDKAAFYMFQITTGHIFTDGNKRTGLAAALVFLELNNGILSEQLHQVENDQGQIIPSKGNNSKEILEHFTLEIADGKIDFEDCKLWFEANVEPKYWDTEPIF